MKRTKCTVEKFDVTPFETTKERPFGFLEPAKITIWVTRTFTDGRQVKALLEIFILRGFYTDGASTFFPISLIVPQWKKGKPRYNAGPTAHDVLYILKGIIESAYEPVELSREEVDDILRGMWRCDGMSRFVAGCADKAIELCAGGPNHWGNDGYEVRDKVRAVWTELEYKA